MAGNDVVFNIRERGGRQTAASTDRVGRGFTRLGRRVRHSSNDVRFFSRATVSATGHMHLFTGAVVTGAGALAGGLYFGLRKVNREWEDSRRVGAGSIAVLKSTGGAANVTNREVGALATTLSRKSGIDDEAIRSGENLLLTFRDVRNEAGRGNDIFTQTIGLATDMSAAFTAAGKSMSVASASLLLGKALNDPAKGLTRLTRAGVSFTQQQQDEIKALAESGDRLGAQRRILAEVRKEFGGAAAKTATPLGKMRVSIQNVEEAIGRGLSPVVDLAAVKIGHLSDEAEPALIKLGDRLNKTFSRKDLDITEKLRIGSKDVHRTFQPFERQIGREIKQLHLGDKIDQGIEYAIPKIADAAAEAAPHAASAFLHGWLHAGIWGKLLTLGLLERRLGVFTALGGLASGRFGRSFVAAEAADAGRWTMLGTRLGRLMGPAMAAAAVTFLGVELFKQFGESFTNLLGAPTEGKIAVDTNRSVIRSRAWARYMQKHPDIERNWLRNAGPGGRQAHRMLNDITAGPLIRGGAAGRYQARRARQLESYLRWAGDPMFTPRSPRELRRIVIENHITLKTPDGKVLLRTIERAAADKQARR